MKKRSKFLIVFASAAITFSSLCAFVGKKHFGTGCCHASTICGQNNCDDKRHTDTTTMGIK